VSSVDDISFFDPEVNRCPYPAYQQLQDEAPVWQDPQTGMFVVTRYEDIKAILMDPATYTNRVGSAAGRTEKAVRPSDAEDAARWDADNEWEERIRNVYVEGGWETVGTLDALDPPEHMELRRLFQEAFRPSRISKLDPYVEGLAESLMDAFIDDGKCEWVAQYAVPLPLYTIGKQMGVPEEDMPRIKGWTDAWVQRLGLMQTPEERLWSATKEVEAQQYFHPIFEQLRENPQDNLLSDLVNKKIPEWDRTLNENELQSEMMADFFVGGAETTANSLSAGMVALIERPELWAQLCSDPDKYLPIFVEEVIRIEGPVQGLLRETSRDVELHGVLIPEGGIVNVRFAAGNRDERQFARADQIDLDRQHPKAHLAFGLGGHFCLGAPLARREMFFGFKSVVNRIESMRFVEGANDFAFHPSYFLRGMKELHIEFTAR
jgi:cytochrome P450